MFRGEQNFSLHCSNCTVILEMIIPKPTKFSIELTSRATLVQIIELAETVIIFECLILLKQVLFAVDRTQKFLTQSVIARLIHTDPKTNGIEMDEKLSNARTRDCTKASEKHWPERLIRYGCVLD